VARLMPIYWATVVRRVCAAGNHPDGDPRQQAFQEVKRKGHGGILSDYTAVKDGSSAPR
jgi:hypothetical protein